MRPSHLRVAHHYLSRLAAEAPSAEFQREVRESVTGVDDLAVVSYTFENGGVRAIVQGSVFLKMDEGTSKALPPRALAEAVVSDQVSVEDLSDEVLITLPLRVLYEKRKLVSPEVMVGAMEGRGASPHINEYDDIFDDWAWGFIKKGLDKPVQTNRVTYSDWGGNDFWPHLEVKGGVLYFEGAHPVDYGPGKLQAVSDSGGYLDFGKNPVPPGLNIQDDTGGGTYDVWEVPRSAAGAKVDGADWMTNFEAKLPILKAPRPWLEHLLGLFVQGG
jgi:hypothetical protein